MNSTPAEPGPAAPGLPGSRELPLFPLRAVLFPGGLLGLRVFEPRYLDLIADCLRQRSGFGVVALRSGGEVRLPAREAVSFEPIGTIAELIEVDSEETGMLTVRASGTQRFAIVSSRQQADGLWLAQTQALPDDDRIAPGDAMRATVLALATAVATLKAQGEVPFISPYHFDDAGWVANRWCEILPISQAAKQKLMALPDAAVRLRLVDDFLRSKGLVS